MPRTPRPEPPHPRFHAQTSRPMLEDPTAVTPEIWDALLEEALMRLRDTGKDLAAVFGDMDVSANMRTLSANIIERWISKGLTSKDAKELADILRETAFEERGAAGEAPLVLNEASDRAPGMLVWLASVLDYLALLAGPVGLICFRREEMA